MGWSNSTFQLLIITSSPAGFSGLFVYSPAPGPGNLIASIASTTGTDPYTNAYKAGVTSYVGGQTSQLTGGLVNVSNQFNNSPGGLSATSGTAGLTELLSPTTGAADVQAILSAYSKNGIAGGPFFLVSNKIVATDPNSGAPETWHTMTITAAGFAAGSPAPRYKLEPDNTVRFSGVVALTANQAANAVFFTMPAIGYRPVNSQFFICANQLSGAAAQNTSLEVDPNGNVSIQVAGTNGNTLALDGVTYVLD